MPSPTLLTDKDAAAFTPTECRVLQKLLSGQSEREIAADLGTTVHSYVTTLYRKGRSGLTALWLGQGLTIC